MVISERLNGEMELCGENGAKVVWRAGVCSTAPVPPLKNSGGTMCTFFFFCAYLSTLAKGEEGYSGVEVGKRLGGATM